MIKLACSLVCVFASTLAIGQIHLDRYVISSGAIEGSTSNRQTSGTIGETVIATHTTATITLTQGFQQPSSIPVGFSLPEIALSAEAYPNPTHDMLLLDFSVPSTATLHLRVVNTYGASVATPETITVQDHTIHPLSLGHLASGQYWLHLSLDPATPPAISIPIIITH